VFKQKICSGDGKAGGKLVCALQQPLGGELPGDWVQ